MLPSAWDRSPVSFEQISQPSFFSQQLLTWFGTFTRTCTAPRGMVVGTCHLQGRHPLPWGRSPVSFGQISLGSVFQGKSWDKGPSNLALPRMVHHQWPAAPDVIWHIYSHLYFSSRDGDRDLPSSGEAASTMGQVPCEFQVDQPNFIFLPVVPDMIWQGGFRYGPAVFRGCCPQHGAGPLWVLSRSTNLHFSASSSWRDLAHLLWAVLLYGGWCHPLAIFRGGAPWSGKGSLWVLQRSYQALR